MKNKKKRTGNLKNQKEISKNKKTNSKLCTKGVNTFVRGPKQKLQ